MKNSFCFILKCFPWLWALFFFSHPATAADFTFEYKGRTLLYSVVSEMERTAAVKSGAPEGASSIVGSVEIPSRVTFDKNEYSVVAIEESAFEDQGSLTYLSCPETVRSIGSFAFSLCSALRTVMLADGLESIGDFAFDSCARLSSIAIPETVNTVGQGAFNQCSALLSVEIPSSVTSISASTFSGCSSLNRVVLPAGITSIGDMAFYGCSALPAIDLPESVATLGEGVFDGCSSLNLITIPKSVTAINSAAFLNCRALTEVSIPDGVTSIGDAAFSLCTALKSITLPTNLQTIGQGAFSRCSGLAEVYYLVDDPVEGESNIFDYYDKVSLYTTAAGAEKARQIAPWCNFESIIVYDDAGRPEILPDENIVMPAVFYNLYGLKVGESIDTLSPGVYIMHQGTTVKKIMVR